jgi:hypothetical protein
MENQNNIQNSTIDSVNAQTADTQVARAAETKTKRSYHRLTDEEKAQRAKEFEAYKAGVAARKEARQMKRAAAEDLFNDRRNVEFDVTELRKASEALLSMSSAPVSDVRANINTLMAAVQKADKLMHHRAKAATVTIK